MMNPVHRVSPFFLHRKTSKYQLGSFTVQFSAKRPHAPLLVAGELPSLPHVFARTLDLIAKR